MKRTVLDIDGVFHTEGKHESSVNRPEKIVGGQFRHTPDASDVASDFDVSELTSVQTVLPKIDMSQVAQGVSLNPDEIEEMITGSVAESPERQALADSVMFQMDPADRKALEELAGKRI